jgi:hypothetical protein
MNLTPMVNVTFQGWLEFFVARFKLSIEEDLLLVPDWSWQIAIELFAMVWKGTLPVTDHLQSMQWNIKWYRSTDHSCLSMSVVICWRFSVRFGLGVPRAERCGLPWSVSPRNPEETPKGPFGPSMVPSRVTSSYLILFVHPHDAKVVHLKLAHIPTGCHCILGMTKKYM